MVDIDGATVRDGSRRDGATVERERERERDVQVVDIDGATVVYSGIQPLYRELPRRAGV